MAYQQNTSLGTRSMPAMPYASGPPTNPNTPHFYPPQQLSHQDHKPFYPNPHPTHSQVPSPSHPHLITQAQVNAHAQGIGFHGQQPDSQRQQFQPNLDYNQNNGQAPLMQPTTIVHDDPFKKPYLPPQRPVESNQYHTQNSQFPPTDSQYSQSPSASNFAYTSGPTAKRQDQVPATPSLSSAISSMTATALPAVSSAQSTPTVENAAQTPDATAPASKLSQLDQDRVEGLLNVNNLLLQHVIILQKAGLKATPNPHSPQQANVASQNSPQTNPIMTDGSTTAISDPNAQTNSTSSTPTTTTPTTTAPQTPTNVASNARKFGEYMGRVKTNIMYLVTISDATKAKHRPPYPLHLEDLPPFFSEGLKEEDLRLFEDLKEAYVKLRLLWPEWKPQPNKQQLGQQAQAMAQQQQAQQQNQQAQLQNQQAQMQHS